MGWVGGAIESTRLQRTAQTEERLDGAPLLQLVYVVSAVAFLVKGDGRAVAESARLSQLENRLHWTWWGAMRRSAPDAAHIGCLNR